MKMRYPTPMSQYVPAETGQVVTVRADDADLLRLMFGAHADDAGEILRRNENKPVNRYVQCAKSLEPKSGGGNDQGRGSWDRG